MREIKPEDVPAMMRDGRLEFGMELEFSDATTFNTIGTGVSVFDGFNIETNMFLCHHKKIEKTPRLYPFARFPLPDLRDGDPVVVRGWEHKDYHRYFYGFANDRILCYAYGRNRWSYMELFVHEEWKEWRIPTPQELKDAGLDPDWFKGRRGVRQ